jgi:radical SAM protein with 4Fe4S-binding SPASM domain
LDESAPHTVTPPLPRRLQVEVTGACNLACRMCLVRYRPKVGRREGALSFETFREVVDALPDLEEVTLQGLGEPLLCPDLPAMVEHGAGRGIRMGFNTNATLLTRAVADRLVAAGVAWVHVSLDGAQASSYEDVRDGGDFARVCRNVEGLVAARRAAGTRDPRVLLVFVAMQRNIADLPGVVRLAARWGVDGVRVQNLSHTFSDTDPAGGYAEIRSFAEDEALYGDDVPRRDEVFAEAAALAERLGVALRLPRLEAAAPERAAGRPGCTWPWDSAYVTHRGSVQPCCMVMGEDRVTMGSVADEDFATVWHGEAYRGFRAGLLSADEPPDVCRGCAMYRGVF